MTVKELIERLQEEDDDLVVGVPGPDHSIRRNFGIFLADDPDENETVLVIE